MKKTLFIIPFWFILNPVYGQISFGDKIDIYDYELLSVDLIYDDFDNDGDLDIIKSFPSSQNNVLLQKNENGDFNSKLSKIIATNKEPIVSLDLNNDGYPDLITRRSFYTIGVMYNLQNDTFSEEETILNFSGLNSIHPLKFDYNGDGFMDLFITHESHDTYVVLNNQNGGFEPPQLIGSFGYYNPIYKIDDFDNDGDFDFYIKDGSYLKIYLNNNGSIEHPNILRAQSSLKSYGILDLDENGFKDILYWKSGAIWAKYFDFDVTTNEFVVLNDIMVVDNIPFHYSPIKDQSIHIENDGNGNYVVYVALETTLNHYNIYKFNIQNGIFSTPQIVLSDFQVNVLNLNQFKFLDLNNDGNLDFTFTSEYNYGKRVFINFDINGSSDKTICIQQAMNPNTFTAIDMNGDGIENIAIGSEKGGLSYIEKTTNNELGNIRNLIGVISNPNASVLNDNHIVDFDNDGLGDVIDFDYNGDYAKVFRNLGADDFEYVQTIPVVHNLTRDIYFVDIDSDGFLDIVFENFDTYPFGVSEFNWAKNNNGVNFGSPQPLVINHSGPFMLDSLAFDDFNNDNQTDILLLGHYYANNQWHSEIILFENQNGQFFGNTIATLDGNYGNSGQVKIKDLNQNGYLDFFVYNKHSNLPFIYFKNNGQNNFDTITIENNNIADIEFDDNDGDGIYEIYAWNYEPNSYLNHIFYYTTTDYLNYTKIEIDSYTAYYDGSNLHGGDLFLYDIDNDGKKDLFISNNSYWEGHISVYKNTTGTLSIEDIENDNNLNQLKLYPNPFVTTIHWNGEENKKYTVQLFNLSGKLLFKKTTSNNSLDLSFLTNGIYLLVVEDESLDYKWSYKIIKK